MKESIINEKLRRELQDLPINTEPRVMYFLVEIRKVLEHEGKTNTILGFYGNWTVHTKMDRKFAHKIFEEVSNEDSEFGSHIKSFRLLSSELEIFLKEHDLPTDLIEDHWANFRETLLEILIDTPIVNEAGDKSFGLCKTDKIGGVQYYLEEDGRIHTFGRAWV